MKFETINGQLCRMVEPEPIFGSTKAPFVIVGKNTKHPTIITQDMDILLRIFLVAYSDEFEIIGYPVADGSAEWALWQMKQGRWVINPSLEQHKTDRNDTRYLHAYGKFGQDIVVKNIITGNDSILGAANIGHWTNYAEPTGWQLYEPQPEPKPEHPAINGYNRYDYIPVEGIRQPKPEPEPKFAVGDWVTDGAVQGRVVTRTSDTTWVEVQDGKQYHIETSHLRKLKPSEVVLDFGSGIKGTVRSCEHDGGCVRVISGDRVIAHIMTDVLEQPTRNLVGQLLKAQEGE